jgi:hypothetical protein
LFEIKRQPDKTYEPFRADTDHLSIFDKPPSTSIIYESDGAIKVSFIENLEFYGMQTA